MKAASRLLRRFRLDSRASAIVEFCFMGMLLLGFFGGFAAYGLALHAKTGVIQAAFAADRTASIECNPQSPGYSASWYSDAVAAAKQTLQDQMLMLSVFQSPLTTQQPGAWYVLLSCNGGEANAEVQYNQLDIFPPLGPILDAGHSSGWSFYLVSGDQLPTE